MSGAKREEKEEERKMGSNLPKPMRKKKKASKTPTLGEEEKESWKALDRIWPICLNPKL